MDKKTRCGASRGRKSKAGGGKKIKSDSRIYTPACFQTKERLQINTGYDKDMN